MDSVVYFWFSGCDWISKCCLCTISQKCTPANVTKANADRAALNHNKPHQHTCLEHLEAQPSHQVAECQSESVIHALRNALRTRLHRRRRDRRHLARHTYALQTHGHALQLVERHVPPDAGHQRVAREAQHICLLNFNKPIKLENWHLENLLICTYCLYLFNTVYSTRTKENSYDHMQDLHNNSLYITSMFSKYYKVLKTKRRANFNWNFKFPKWPTKMPQRAKIGPRTT